jgi:hypothetical protein
MKINNIVRTILVIAGVLLLCFPAYANDAISFLFIHCFSAFILGSICALVVEYVYCVFRFRKTGYLRNFLFVITANTVTTIMGFFVMALIPYSLFLKNDGPLLIFFICYLCTVPVEALILKLFLSSTERLTFFSAFLNAVAFNVLSYIGIMAIFYSSPVKYG